MTLKEVKNGHISEYPDSQSFPLNRCAKMFGCGVDAFAQAALRVGIKAVEGEPRFPNQPRQRLIEIKNFPSIIRGFGQVKVTGHDVYYHPWAAGVDTTQNFQVTPKSGSILFYEYEEPKS